MALPGLTDALQPPNGDITRLGKTAFPTDETFLLQGNAFPGQWLLTEMSNEFGWQEQKGYGLNGAFVIPTGQPLRKMKFSGLLWTETQAVAYNLLRKRYLVDLAASSAFVPTPPAQRLTTAIPLTIAHSEVNRNGITSVVVTEYSALVQEEGGLWRGNISFLQYRRPKPAPSRPTQSINGTSTQQNGPLTDVQAQNQQLTNQTTDVAGQIAREAQGL